MRLRCHKANVTQFCGHKRLECTAQRAADAVRQPVGTFAEYGRGLDLVELLSHRTIAGECDGKPVPGAPTAVLDSGQGNDRTQLQPIGDALLDQAMVCSYDQAGYGGSDPAPTPRPITQVVEDLHTSHYLDRAARHRRMRTDS